MAMTLQSGTDKETPQETFKKSTKQTSKRVINIIMSLTPWILDQIIKELKERRRARR